MGHNSYSNHNIQYHNNQHINHNLYSQFNTDQTGLQQNLTEPTDNLSSSLLSSEDNSFKEKFTTIEDILHYEMSDIQRGGDGNRNFRSNSLPSLSGSDSSEDDYTDSSRSPSPTFRSLTEPQKMSVSNKRLLLWSSV